MPDVAVLDIQMPKMSGIEVTASAIESEIHHRMDSLRGLAFLSGDGSLNNLNQALDQSKYLLDDFDHGLSFLSQDGSLLVSVGERHSGRTSPVKLT